MSAAVKQTEADRRLTARIHLGDREDFGSSIERWISTGEGAPPNLSTLVVIVAKERAKNELQARAWELERVIGWNGIAPLGVMPVGMTVEAMRQHFKIWKDRHSQLLDVISEI